MGATRSCARRPASGRRSERDALTDHFVENYHRVISKEREKELKFKELLKQLRELEASFPALSEAPAIAEGADSSENAHSYSRRLAQYRRCR